jgi:hypothetical protein
VHVFGAYNWRDGYVFHQSYLNKNSESFIDFVDDLMRQVPSNKKVIMVLDNVSYHRSHSFMATHSIRGAIACALVAHLLPSLSASGFI